jgi:hypothetical protein
MHRWAHRNTFLLCIINSGRHHCDLKSIWCVHAGCDSDNFRNTRDVGLCDQRMGKPCYLIPAPMDAYGDDIHEYTQWTYFIVTHLTCCCTNIPFDSLRDRSIFFCMEDMDATELATCSWNCCVDRLGRPQSSNIIHIFNICIPYSWDVLQVTLTQSINITTSSFRVCSMTPSSRSDNHSNYHPHSSWPLMAIMYPANYLPFHPVSS